MRIQITDINTSDNIELLGHEAPILGLSLDPKEEFVVKYILRYPFCLLFNLRSSRNPPFRHRQARTDRYEYGILKRSVLQIFGITLYPNVTHFLQQKLTVRLRFNRKMGVHLRILI